jgi:hypothetical protein
MKLDSAGSRLVAFLEHPFTAFFVGAVLVLSGLDELLQESGADGLLGLGVHHGVIVYGLHKALLAIGDLVEGGREALDGHRHRRKRAIGPVAAAVEDE